MGQGAPRGFLGGHSSHQGQAGRAAATRGPPRAGLPLLPGPIKTHPGPRVRASDGNEAGVSRMQPDVPPPATHGPLQPFSRECFGPDLKTTAECEMRRRLLLVSPLTTSLSCPPDKTLRGRRRHTTAETRVVTVTRASYSTSTRRLPKVTGKQD